MGVLMHLLLTASQLSVVQEMLSSHVLEVVAQTPVRGSQGRTVVQKSGATEQGISALTQAPRDSSQ